MRRRLVITYLSLLAAVLLGLSVPLAIALANNLGQRMFTDRQGDTARFASLAEPALRNLQPGTLPDELVRYDQMFGIAAVILTRDGRPYIGSREIDLSKPELRRHVDAALAGQRTELNATVWPWRSEPMVVAEPVGRGGEVIGAVLTISPTDGLAAAIWRSWSAVAGASAAALVAGVAAATPLASWMLRPVRRLDQAAHALAAGRFGDQALAVTGPSELRRLTESFNTMAERVATLVGRQRDFVSFASHQLRTPLATLRLWVDNLEPWVQPEGRGDHGMVAAEVERMGAMCDALLTYARADATAGDVTDLDAAEVAGARVALWSQAAEQAGISLVRAGERRAPVRAAPQALDQALDALLSNAVKYVGKGGQVVVMVDVPNREWVEIHVIDNGPGLPAHELDQAVQPFWRAAEHQRVDGAGLGMTIADALVTASGGRLDLLPAEPHGLHARVRLPAGRS